jgi:hypothetical protein
VSLLLLLRPRAGAGGEPPVPAGQRPGGLATRGIGR